MPRQPRIDIPGLVNHVIVRGIERRDIFVDDADRREFLRRMGKLVGGDHSQIYAFCLMPNHVHLALRMLTVPLATFMRRLLTGYALYFNRRHKRSGHLFQNRYKSFVVDEDAYLVRLICYIHLNPIRAGLVDSIEALGSWPYSGYGALMGRVKLPWYEADAALALFGPTHAVARRKLAGIMCDGAADTRQEELSGGGLKQSLSGLQKQQGGERLAFDARILGVGGFVEDVLASLEKRSGTKGACMPLDMLFERVAAHCGLSIAELSSGSKRPAIAQARAAAVWCAIKHTTASTTELAASLGITRAAVCAIVRSGRGEAMGCSILLAH